MQQKKVQANIACSEWIFDSNCGDFKEIYKVMKVSNDKENPQLRVFIYGKNTSISY